MPTKKTEAEILTAELIRMKDRLAKKNLGHLDVDDLTIRPTEHIRRCERGFSPRMVQQDDGSFKLECVKDL